MNDHESRLLDTHHIHTALSQVLEQRVNKPHKGQLEEKITELEELFEVYRLRKARLENMKVASSSFFEPQVEDPLTSVKATLKDRVIEIKAQNEAAATELQRLENEYSMFSEVLRCATGATLCKSNGDESTFSIKSVKGVNSPELLRLKHSKVGTRTESWNAVYSNQVGGKRSKINT